MQKAESKINHGFKPLGGTAIYWMKIFQSLHDNRSHIDQFHQELQPWVVVHSIEFVYLIFNLFFVKQSFHYSKKAQQ